MRDMRGGEAGKAGCVDAWPRTCHICKGAVANPSLLAGQLPSPGDLEGEDQEQ